MRLLRLFAANNLNDRGRLGEPALPLIRAIRG
ncbi:MAG: hypothetical protein RL077_5839 [Verrucomicrobiota bacterium]|jgi:hypothetical protein